MMSPDMTGLSRPLRVAETLLTNGDLIDLFEAAGVIEGARATYRYVNRFNPELPITFSPTGSLSVRAGWEQHPAVGISWFGACLAASLLGGRLPTREEWQAIASQGEPARYPWGDDPIDPSRANVDHQVGSTTPVGSYPPSHGLYDLIGNADEWCADSYDQNPASADSNLTPRPSMERTVCGGSWASRFGAISIWNPRGKWARVGTRSIGLRPVWDPVGGEPT